MMPVTHTPRRQISSFGRLPPVASELAARGYLRKKAIISISSDEASGHQNHWSCSWSGDVQTLIASLE
jgi:hypothetical protein